MPAKQLIEKAVETEDVYLRGEMIGIQKGYDDIVALLESMMERERLGPQSFSSDGKIIKAILSDVKESIQAKRRTVPFWSRYIRLNKSGV